MLYKVNFSAAERELLTPMVGQPLELVQTDGWAVELSTPSRSLLVLPEEVSTPDADHPFGDVKRPLIAPRSQSMTSPSLVGESLGRVRAVKALTTLLSFSPVVNYPSGGAVAGVNPPPSQEYGHVYSTPHMRQRVIEEAQDSALVEVDVALEIVADYCDSLVVYTRGFFVCASFGLPADEDWARLQAFDRRVIG